MGFDSTRSLKCKFPEIAKEWHPTLNDPLTPKDVAYGSSQVVWWQCSKCNDHQWEKAVKLRTLKDGRKCPFCNTLAFKFPEIAKEWHPTLNDPLTPKDVTYGSNQIVWWQCSKFKNHKWESCIKERINCPHCRKNKNLKI